jgi:Leucine-rich repeat (LRR) protein
MQYSKTIIEKNIPEEEPEDQTEHKFRSYCCPSCSNLPEILYYNKLTDEIKIKCKTHGENTLRLREYLEQMANFVNTSEIKKSNKCTNHNENFMYYCKDCDLNLCERCLELPEHENHVKYEIKSTIPDDKRELLLLNNEIKSNLDEKRRLKDRLRALEDKITFYDALINAYKSNSPNFLLNINIKHILYGENLNIEQIKNTEKNKFDDFINENFMKATEGLNQISLVDKKAGNNLLELLFKGIEDHTVFQILKLSNKIQDQSGIISLKNIKYLNLRGNDISDLNFLLNKEFPSLEIFSLNNNALSNIEDLKSISFPKLKELYLSKNKINDIDILGELELPELNILWLSDNNIINIDVLENVKFPKLLKLNLSKNKIKDISVLAHKKAKFPQLYELYLNDNEFDTNKFSEIMNYLFNKLNQFYY